MDIKFLYFEGCPNSEGALQLLKEVCKEYNIPEENIEMVEINSMEEAIKYRFLGSPSIQINGRDIESSRWNDKPLYGCRVYNNKENPGIPPRSLIEEAIKSNLNK